MANTENGLFGRKIPMTEAPKLGQYQFWLSNLVGLVFLGMAILQLASFGDFRDNFEQVGMSSATVWGVVVILLELWAAAGFFKLRLSYAFRVGSLVSAFLAAGFWFIYTIQLIANGNAVVAGTSNIFGGSLTHQSGWLTVVGVSLLLYLTLYFISISRPNLVLKRR